LFQVPSPDLGQSSALGVMTSHDVDLRRDSSVDLRTTSSPAAKPLNRSIGSESSTQPAASLQASRAVKRTRTPVTRDSKTQSVEEVSAQSQASASAAQQETLVSAAASQAVDPEAPTNPPQANIALADSTQERTSPASAHKTVGSEPKSPSIFVEVGSFKDETWANNAVDKLTQLGFHAILIHKTLLWAQSFHVQVGPYTDPKEIEAVRQSLASHGFKSHAVN